MAWILALLAASFGTFGDRGLAHFVLFGIVGWLLGKDWKRSTSPEVLQKLDELERVNASLRTRVHALESGKPLPQVDVPPASPAPRGSQPTPDFQLPFESPTAAKTPARPPATSSPTPERPLGENASGHGSDQRPTAPPVTPREPEPPRAPAPPHPIVAAITNFFTTGNLFAKVGAILLFFGVGFLIKFVSDMGLFPIEGRLIGTALAANLLIAFGWKLRKRREAYALILQGVGFGILYLTVFGAFRQWNLLPAPLAFGVLVAATLLFSLLAVLQNAPSLAALAVTGGFLAPLLVSTGSGNFVALFSYYSVLNVGILAITWFRAWRGLHVLGFVFTYGVGWLWGREYFQPQHFHSVEPFLLFHFALYVIVALRFARLQRAVTRAFAVDGLLVFGVPMATFALQSAMLRDTRYGIALTAAALGLFYLTLASILFRRKNPEARALVESFLASGLLFNTLAVPFALSHTWTSAVWAIEGAFLVWYGARQGRKTIRAFGYLLQALGYLAYVWKSVAVTGLVPWVNPGFLGAMTLFAAAIFTGRQLFKKPGAFTEQENALLKPFLFVAFLWLLFGFYREAAVTALYWLGPDASNFEATVASFRVGFLGAIVLVIHFVASRLAWAALAAIRFALFSVVFFAWPILGTAHAEGAVPYLNPAFWSALVFAAAALVSGASLATWPTRGQALWARAFLVTGWTFWTFAHWAELEYGLTRWFPLPFADGTTAMAYRGNLFLVLVAGSALFFALLGRLCRRPALADYRYALTGLGALTLIGLTASGKSPFAYGGLVAWVALLGTHYFLLWRRERGATTMERWSHFSGLWLTTALVGWFGYQLAEAHVSPTSVWKETLLLSLPIVLVALVLRWPEGRFPFGRDRQAYLTWGLLPHLVGLTFLSQYWNLTNPGDPSPLPYVPAANPLGLAVGGCLLTLVFWHQSVKNSRWATSPRRFAGLIGGFAFLWLTMGVVRAVHHFAGVPWDPDLLASSGQLQTSLSIFWSCIGLATMIVGHRRGVRALWIFGCCLMVLVVVKLFAIDLKERGTLERIISFIGTGVVLLLTGYFAPIPPSTKKAPQDAA